MTYFTVDVTMLPFMLQCPPNAYQVPKPFQRHSYAQITIHSRIPFIKP